MEAAPLTLAHAHARNAALETKRSNPVAASEEHDLAAVEFAAAAQDSSDPEALRILNLLEQHHKKLGQILRTSHEKPVVENSTQVLEPTIIEPAKVSTPYGAKTEPAQTQSSDITIHPPRLTRAGRPNARDLSSSIASNLASARGIPAHRQKRSTPISPLVSNQHAGGQFTQDENRGKSVTSQSSEKQDNWTRTAQARPSWTPPTIENLSKTEVEQASSQNHSDAPFQQFYSTFESLISKLSAPLAFAGLPLTTPTPKSPPSPTQPIAKINKGPNPRPAETTSSIDYSQLISRAALRAVHSNAPGGAYLNPSESFYVVPTTGGTFSYADIMNRVEREETRNLRHQRQISNLTHISEDDFVDARSSVLTDRSQSNTKSRGAGTKAEEVKVNGKTMEELALDNEALKHLSDTLAKRLHVFEMSAQTSSAALAQSIRSLQRSPLTSPENSRGKTPRPKPESAIRKKDVSEDQTSKRITELEEILHKSDARAKKKDEENAKLRETIVKYRDKWDSLKAGAKARREGQLQSGKDRASGTGGSNDGRSGSRDDDIMMSPNSPERAGIVGAFDPES